MSKETVTIPTAIEHEGIQLIRYLVGRKHGIHLTDELMGGPYRVNSHGKMSKRIRRNLKRELGVSIDNQTMSEIGNAVNTYSLKDESYLVEYVDDLHSVVGNFADDESCFRKGKQNYHHLLAMIDAGVLALCIYRTNGRNLGRAWCYRPNDEIEVLFNAYGFDLKKIAKIASVLNGGIALDTCRIYTNHNIWLNNGGSAYALGQNPSREYEMVVKSPDSFAPHRCQSCDRPIWNDEDIRELENGETWCASCWRRRFWNCPRCGNDVDTHNETIQNITGSRSYDNLCLACASAYYHRCDHCQENSSDDHWYELDALRAYETRDGEALTLCGGHYRRRTNCEICGNRMPAGTAIEAHRSGNRVHRLCVACVNGRNDVSYCPDCDKFSIDPFREHRAICRVCGRDHIDGNSTWPLLIIQDPERAGTPELTSFRIATGRTADTGTPMANEYRIEWTEVAAVNLDDAFRILDDNDGAN